MLHLLCINLTSALRHHIGMAAVGQKSDDSGHTGSQSQQMPVPVPLHVADFFFFWGGGGRGAGELFITLTCNERNHKCQIESRSQPKLQATVTTCKEANTEACKKSACQAKQAKHMSLAHQLKAQLVRCH